MLKFIFGKRRLFSPQPLIHGREEWSFFQTGGHLDEKLCEISYLADRHIISDECANFAQLLAKKVRERKINYSREELIALTLHQAARSVTKMFLSLDQISYLLCFRLEEKSFWRKLMHLCLTLPSSFTHPNWQMMPLLLNQIGMGGGDETYALNKKCRQLQKLGHFSFSFNTALFVILSKVPGYDIQLLKLICSFPSHREIIRANIAYDKAA